MDKNLRRLLAGEQARPYTGLHQKFLILNVADIVAYSYKNISVITTPYASVGARLFRVNGDREVGNTLCSRRGEPARPLFMSDNNNPI